MLKKFFFSVFHVYAYFFFFIVLPPFSASSVDGTSAVSTFDGTRPAYSVTASTSAQSTATQSHTASQLSSFDKFQPSQNASHQRSQILKQYYYLPQKRNQTQPTTHSRVQTSAAPTPSPYGGSQLSSTPSSIGRSYPHAAQTPSIYNQKWLAIAPVRSSLNETQTRVAQTPFPTFEETESNDNFY